MHGRSATWSAYSAARAASADSGSAYRWCRIVAVIGPRLRCVAAMLAIVTPAVSTRAAPGTDRRSEEAPAVPAHGAPPRALTNRSCSVRPSRSARGSGGVGGPAKARSGVLHQASHSWASNVRSCGAVHQLYQGLSAAEPLRDGGATRPGHRLAPAASPGPGLDDPRPKI